MQDGFELLEEKVRRAADLVKKLRRENKTLEEDLTKSKWRVQEAEKRLEALEKEVQQAAKAGDTEALVTQVTSLKQEREEVRRRIAKLVEVLEALEA